MKLDPEERILLTKEDYDHIVKAINSPPQPTSELIAAAKRYKERFKNETKT